MVLVTRLRTPLFVAGLLVAVLPASAAAQPVTQATGDPYYEFLMAQWLEAQGDAAGALAALQRAAALDTRSAAVRAEIAAFQMRRNRRDEAEKAAGEALALDADNADAHRVLGLILAGRADVTGRAQTAAIAAGAREAIAHLEKASASTASASDVNLLYTLGRLYLRNGDAEKAVQTLMRVVGLNPDSSQARLTLAQAYVGANNLESAIGTLEEVAADEPRVSATLGQYLEQAGRSADAALAYGRAITLAPTNGELKFRRLAALFNAGQFSEAATLAAEAQRQHPDDIRFPRIRAQALLQSGAGARAIDVLEPVARANPSDVATLFALADLYTDAGRFSDAERTMRQLLNVTPDNADALNYLGYQLAQRGVQLDEAIRLVRKALDIEPDNPTFLDSLGWAYFRRGDVDSAERYLAPAADKLPKNSVIQDHLGDVLARRGRWQDAVTAWTRALEGDGEGVDRQALTKKIDDARAKVQR